MSQLERELYIDTYKLVTTTEPYKTQYEELSKTIDEISQKITDFKKKPIIEVKIQGENIETDIIQAQIAKLNSLALRCFWRISTKQVSDSSVFLDSNPSIPLCN